MLDWARRLASPPLLTGAVVTREAEFSKTDYELLAALAEHEATVDEHGFPFDESMTILADPLNPEGTHRFVAKPARNWATDALEQAQKDPKYSGENYSAARKWRVLKEPR